MNRIYLAFTVIASMLLSSCGTSVKVQRPPETYTPASFTPRNSVISMTTQVKVSDIQKRINQEFSGLIYDDNSLENNNKDNLMVKAWKQGDIRLDMNGNTLTYKVPLKLWIKAGFNIQKFGLTLSDYRELNGALSLSFSTSVKLNDDWTVTTKTNADGYDWITTPSVRIGGMDFSVKFVADIVLQATLKKVGSIIDESIKEYLNLRPYAQQAWELAQKPLLLNETYNAWLQISPSKLISSNLTAVNGNITHKSGITGAIIVDVKSKENQSTDINEKPLKPLPALLIGEVPVDQTTIFTYVTVPYTELSRQAVAYLKGKEFSYGKRSVVIEDLKIYGSEGSIVAETRLSGSLTGTIYFRGRPEYNPTDSSLRVQDFDYDISTKNFLVKSASWLYQDGFRRMIAKELNWSIAKEMGMVKKLINDNLQNYELTQGVYLNGSVNRIEPASILITSEGIIPEIRASGKLGIDIKP